MLEFIKELMPLLEGAKDGAIWLIAAYFGLLLTKMLLIAGVILLIVRWGVSLWHSILDQDAVKKNDWNMYQWDTRDGRRVSALFDRETMQDFLEAISTGGFIHISDLRYAKELVERDRAPKEPNKAP